MSVSRLGLRWRTRPGEVHKTGSFKTERRYLEFTIDGRSLQDEVRPSDHVSPIGCWTAEFQRHHLDQLLLRAAGESPTGRVPIFVCAECGDLGCGAVTVAVERTTEGFVWRDFAYENNYDPAMTDVDSYREVGPFLSRG
jgi:hypothetical protein